MSVELNFDASQVAPDTGFETVPAGWYNVAIDESARKPTKDGTGSYLELRFNILDGQYMGRKLFTRLNIQNANPQTVEIAHRQLSAIGHAVGVIRIQNSAMLHGLPLKVKVNVRKDKNGEYDDQNDIKAYKNINEQVETVGANGGPSQAGFGGAPGGFGGAPQGHGIPNTGQPQGYGQPQGFQQQPAAQMPQAQWAAPPAQQQPAPQFQQPAQQPQFQQPAQQPQFQQPQQQVDPNAGAWAPPGGAQQPWAQPGAGAAAPQGQPQQQFAQQPAQQPPQQQMAQQPHPAQSAAPPWAQPQA